MIPQKIFQIGQFIRYKLKASHRKGHGVHSPFVFDFVQQVIERKEAKINYRPVIRLKKQWCANSERVVLESLGARSAAMKKKQQTISTIARVSGIRNRYGKILFNLVAHYKPKKVLELGTNLGLGSCWLASANKGTAVYTLEAQQVLIDKAKKGAQELALLNINFLQGDFDSLLPPLVNEHDFDIVFIDGNHTYEATKRYFELLMENTPENTLLVFDDIYWSQGMTKAWNEIKKDNRSVVSIDLFQFGIIVKNTKITPRNYTLRY